MDSASLFLQTMGETGSKQRNPSSTCCNKKLALPIYVCIFNRVQSLVDSIFGILMCLKIKYAKPFIAEKYWLTEIGKFRSLNRIDV